VSRQLSEIERRRRVYLGDKPPPALSGRTIIIVDDDIVCLSSPSPFIAVRAYYGDFPQLADADVIALLEERHQAMTRPPGRAPTD
jgi:putative phosphoribosyl transferase